MKILRNSFRSGYRYWFYCPGCKHAHSYTVGCNIPDQNWTFEQQTVSFSPSLRVYTTHPVTKAETTLCHLFIKNGKIEFCGDCEHELKGQHVNLPEFPKDYGVPEPWELVV